MRGCNWSHHQLEMTCFYCFYFRGLPTKLKTNLGGEFDNESNLDLDKILLKLETVTYFFHQEEPKEEWPTTHLATRTQDRIRTLY